MQGETQLLHPLFETMPRSFTLHVNHFDFGLSVFVGSLKWCKTGFFLFGLKNYCQFSTLKKSLATTTKEKKGPHFALCR
jgi:hypothetical protein